MAAPNGENGLAAERPALESWARREKIDLDVSQATKFSKGLANLNYAVTVNGHLAVLRRPPRSALGEGANDMAREFRVLSALHRHYALAPRPLAYCSDRSVIGAPFQLIEFRPGVSFGSELPPGAGPDAASKITRGLVDAMTTLHALRPDVLGLSDFGEPKGFLARQVAGWTRRGRAIWRDAAPKPFDRITRKLAESVPAHYDVSILHLDFKFDNMLFEPTTLTPTAVIDWDLAARGCALFDLAVLLSYWVERGDPPAVHAIRQVPSLLPGFPSRAQVVDAYFGSTGRAFEPLGWFIALARVRLAVAWMQMYRGWERGDLRGPRYETFADEAVSIVDWAEQAFEGHA